MAKLAFCGLGLMGSAMAERLLDAGNELTVWNRTPDKADPLVKKGARRALTPAGAAAGVEASITMLATPDAVREVLGGEDGLIFGLTEGSTLIEMSTIGPEAVLDAARRLPAGVEMLDAPVLGSLPQAKEGTLKIFIGGSEDVCTRWIPLLEALGSPRRVGPLGAGAAMKVVANSTLTALMTALGEALALADAFGLEQGAVLDVLSESTIGATTKRKRSNLETGAYPANFKLELALKDAELVVAAADRAALQLPVARAARSWLEQARDDGLGEMDYSAVVAKIRGKAPSAASQGAWGDRREPSGSPDRE